MAQIDKNTFLLLDEYSSSLKSIAEKLQKDEAFSILAEREIKASSTAAISIPEYVFYEIATIFNICVDLKTSLKNSNERFGLVFIGLKFYNPRFLKNYAQFEGLINGENKEITTYYTNYSEKVRGYQKLLSTQSISLLFPKILKHTNHPLFDGYATSLYRFASLIIKLDYEITIHEEAALKKIWRLTHNPDETIISENSKNVPNNLGGENSQIIHDESLEDILNELNGLIGLKSVKQEVATLVNFVKIQKERETQGLKTSTVSYHCVFTGSPGTGKTTVARIIAKIYKKLGVIEKGQLIETDRSGLIAEYSGQTAVKVDNVIQSALDGILFIDEAYALIGENRDDYGREAVATLIKRIEDYRNRLVVIVAGYPDEMETFINDNPGLKSRFNRYLHFEDYSSKELLEIFKSFCNKLDYKLTKKASSKLSKHFTELIENKDESFGNGRLSRNLFEKSIEKQANRLSLSSKPLTKELLITIDVEDIPE